MEKNDAYTGRHICLVKASCWLEFWIFLHPAWAVGSYSSGPSAAGTVGTKVTGGFYQADVSPCNSLSQCYKEATDEQRASLTLDTAFMAEVEQLKKAYNGEVFCFMRISCLIFRHLWCRVGLRLRVYQLGWTGEAGERNISNLSQPRPKCQTTSTTMCSRYSW